MKTTLILFISILISKTSFSQTFDETSKWIGSNTKGSEQVYYNNEENTIHFVSVRQTGSLQSAYINSFNPKDVYSISKVKDKYGKYSLKLHFKDDGSLVTKKLFDSENELVGDVNKIRMYGFEIYLNCDEEMAERFKKAFIHLFKEIDVVVKNGDLF